MKKYLMTGIAALAMCAAFTSCSKDIEQISQEDLNRIEAQKIVDNYNQAFIKTFGQPAANQDWGFGTGTRSAFTRAADPGNRGEYFGSQQAPEYAAMGLVAPDMVSEDEEIFVTNWFRTHPDLQSENVDLSTFFVQQVHFGTQEYTTSTGHKVVGGQHMDWLCAYDPTGHTETIYGQEEFGWQPYTYTTHDDHINNFNTSAPARYWREGGYGGVRDYMASMMLMVNSSTERFGFSESFNTNPASSDANRNPDNKRIYYNYVLVSITYNGKTNYYVGFDYECHGNQGDLEPNGLYDDRIIKIVPGNGSTPPPPSEWDIRVIAEDLNASATTDKVNSDWDFNDVVFDVKFLDTPQVIDGENYNVKIRVVAAGGTYPLYVGGQEVHALFGKDTDVMINTKANFGKHYDTDVLPVFYIADDNAKSTNGKSIAVTVDMGNGPIEMTAEVGKPAAKIGVSPNFNYCMERVDITTIYPLFNQWVTTATPTTGWWDSTITGQ